MPVKQIAPPIPIWGGYQTGLAEQQLIECFNNSSGTLAHGDVVVVDNGAAQMPAQGGMTGAVTTTATAQDAKTLGVVSIDGSSAVNGGVVQMGAVCFVCVSGVARVNIGAATIAAGGALASAAVAKQAATPGTPAVGSGLGIALEANTAKDAFNTIRALIKTG